MQEAAESAVGMGCLLVIRCRRPNVEILRRGEYRLVGKRQCHRPSSRRAGQGGRTGRRLAPEICG
jgi:hypothetical protein